MAIEQEYQASYFATAGTASVAATGRLSLHSVVVPKATAGTLSFQDVTGGVYFAFPTASVANTYIFDSALSNGLQVVASSAADQITVNWKR